MSTKTGGSPLSSTARKFKPGQLAIVLTVVIGSCLLIWNLNTTGPADKVVVVENGMGGPEEPLMRPETIPEKQFSVTRDGVTTCSDQSSTGYYSSVVITGTCLPFDQLGPLGRLDEGTIDMVIGRNETFYDALAARDIPHNDIMSLVKACKEFRNLRNVRTGELFKIEITTDGGLKSLAFDLDLESFVTWTREGDSYKMEAGSYPVEHRLKGVSGEIRNSLYASLQQLSAPLALASKMNDILGWDIDFSRDLRKGDTFHIIYEEIWKDGKYVRTGPIQSLEMVTRGKVRKVYSFEDEDGKPGYYDNDGKNMQKQLMRAPLQYSRISSKFSYRRFHPVLKKWMPHLGVDYAAPVGTPVRAAGNGTVVTAARKKGNGRYIQIKHTNREYETYYLHLSRYAKGVRKGSKVTQGQIIGYVGATGYATGPHLDFRVKKSGKFVNPRSLKLPAAAPIATELKEKFSDVVTMYDVVINDLPAATEPMSVFPVMPVTPPAWGGLSYTGVDLPELIRLTRTN